MIFFFFSKIIFYGEIMDKNPITKIVDWYNEAKKTDTVNSEKISTDPKIAATNN